MLYHSPIKHFLKGLLGRKNEAWYLDALISNYKGHSYSNFLNYTNESNVQLPKHVKEHPLFDRGNTLRKESIRTYQNVISPEFKVAIQVPPSHFSPGGFSFYAGLAQSLDWMGATVINFWPVLPSGAATEILDLMIIGNLNEYLTAIEVRENNDHTILVKHRLVTVDLLSTDTIMAEKLILKAISFGVNGFISHYFQSFVTESRFSEIAIKYGLPVYSLPIGLNALNHYPEQFIFPRFNYLFLASANYDKAKRTFEYLRLISRDINGCIIGPGWPWSEEFIMQTGAEKKILSYFKISLNLHLQSQIDYKTEINERVYINAATGMPQVTDSPALISHLFPESSFVAKTPKQYNELAKVLLREPFKFKQEQNIWMDCVFLEHTLFQRLTNLLGQLKS